MTGVQTCALPISLACLLLGKTCVNIATERMLNPVMPALDTPTMKAPRTAHIHCRGSAVIVCATVDVDPAFTRRLRQAGDDSIVGVELPQPVQVDNDVVAPVNRQFGAGRKFIAGVEIRDLGMQVVHCALEHLLRHPFGVR